MADVHFTPQIRCDNCGKVADKVADKFHPHDWKKPRKWGSAKLEGSVDADSYGAKAKLSFVDLCPVCAQSALAAADSALRNIREKPTA